jgi:hypothetical protein
MFNQVDVLGKVLKAQVIKIAKINAASWAGREKKNLSPSTDFMCMTKTFFNFKFSGSAYMEPADDEFSYENERAKEIGNNFHNFIESVLKKTDVLRLSETTMEDEEHHIRARLDMIVEIEGQLYLVELKSAKQYSVKMMQQENSPDMEHQKQIQLYFHLYEKNKMKPEIYSVLKGRPINKGIIFYEDKDGHKITEFYVAKNPALIQELLRYADVLYAHVKKGEQPNFKFEPESRECMFKCKPQYYALCHGKERVDARKKTHHDLKDAPGIWGLVEKRRVADEEGFV